METSLDIKGLYDARGRIVHQAIESPEKFHEKTRLLEAVAAELLRYRFALPFDVNNPLAAKLPGGP